MKAQAELVLGRKCLTIDRPYTMAFIAATCYDNHGQDARDDASECLEELPGGYAELVNHFNQAAGFGIDTENMPDSAGLGCLGDGLRFLVGLRAKVELVSKGAASQWLLMRSELWRSVRRRRQKKLMI